MIAHNVFALPVLIPTTGALDWTIREIKGIDIKTRKILTLKKLLILSRKSGTFYLLSSSTNAFSILICLVGLA